MVPVAEMVLVPSGINGEIEKVKLREKVTEAFFEVSPAAHLTTPDMVQPLGAVTVALGPPIASVRAASRAMLSASTLREK